MGALSASKLVGQNRGSISLCALSPRVWNERPSLKSRQIPALVAHNATARTEEEPGQKHSFNPAFGKFSSELVSLAHTAVR